MKKQITVTKTKLSLKIERPNGVIEVVDVTDKFLTGNIPAPLFEKIKKDTAAAGRGKVLSQEKENIKVVIDVELPDDAAQVDNYNWIKELPNGNFESYLVTPSGVSKSGLFRNEAARILKKNQELFRKLMPTEWAMHFES